MATFNWNISQLDRKTEDGFVTTAHWTVVAEDGEYSASAYGSAGFSGELTTPYASLTKEQVLGWVWDSVNKDEMEANLAAQIEAAKTPKTAAGVPWASAE